MPWTPPLRQFAALSLTTALLAPSPARATDNDGDGYHAEAWAWPARDCNDNNNLFHPNAQEVVGDVYGFDGDCDGTDAVMRKYLVRSFPLGPWQYTGDVYGVGTPPESEVQVGLLPFKSGLLRQTLNMPIFNGKVHVVLALTDNDRATVGPECVLRVGTRSSIPPFLPDSFVEYTLTGQGTGTLTTGALAVVDAPRHLRELAIDCDAGATVTIDWLSVQNTSDVVAPAENTSVAWEDMGFPGGGLASVVVRTLDGQALWAGSDVGGVARRDGTTGSDEWRAVSGDPALGALSGQPDLAVWDVLPSSWSEVFILTGRQLGDSSVHGGLLSSLDNGESWQRLVDSEYNSLDSFPTTVGAYGRFSGCADAGYPKELAGGALLAEEASTQGVYLANHDRDYLGLAYWDGVEACELASADLPHAGVIVVDDCADATVQAAAASLGLSLTTLSTTATGGTYYVQPWYGNTPSPDDDVFAGYGTISMACYAADPGRSFAGYPAQLEALARVSSVDNGLPALVVGYRGMAGTDDAVYLCSLPVDGTGAVDFDCADTSGVSCQPVTDLAGVDVRDIEVDPLAPSVFYVADGGNSLSLGTCEDGEGGLYWLEVTDDGAGNLDWVYYDDLVGDMDIMDPGDDIELTGVSLDPEGDYLFAFAPPGLGSGYSKDRIYRIAYDDVLAGSPYAWTPINGTADGDQATWDDEDERAGNLDLSGAWLDPLVATDFKPRVSQQGTAATYAPGLAIDGVWLQDGSEVPEDCDGDSVVDGYSYPMVITTGLNTWRVDNLDGCDPLWDPDADTTWTFWPEPTEPNGQAWQTTAVNGVAWDVNNNVWANVGDLGLAVRPAGKEEAEVDCLWDAFNGGGSKVVATPDGTVWMTLYDQDAGGVTVPHNVGVFRRLDGSLEWEYEGAAVGSPEYAYTDDDDGVYYDHVWCIDKDDTHMAAPLDSLTDQWQGNAFLETTATSEEDVTAPSWGQPLALDALDADTALVGFRGYAASTPGGGAPSFTQTGRVGYTLDGGENWDSVDFDGGPNACDETAFFANLNDLALVHNGEGSYNAGGTAWRLEFFLSSRNKVAEDHCALARVLLEPDPDGLPGATWTWYDLDKDDAELDCDVDGDNLAGVATAPWGQQAFIYGWYTFDNWGAAPRPHHGGVCAVDVQDPAGVTEVLDPDEWRFSIGDVAPHPWVGSLLAIAPMLETTAWVECREEGEGDCPDAPRLLLAERDGTAWTLTQVSSMAPSLVGDELAWAPLDQDALVYGTAGSGAWIGNLSWD